MHPDYIFPLVLTSATQELFGCRADEDLTEASPHKLLDKEDVVQDMKTRAAVSDFSPVKQFVLVRICFFVPRYRLQKQTTMCACARACVCLCVCVYTEMAVSQHMITAECRWCVGCLFTCYPFTKLVHCDVFTFPFLNPFTICTQTMTKSVRFLLSPLTKTNKKECYLKLKLSLTKINKCLNDCYLE